MFLEQPDRDSLANPNKPLAGTRPSPPGKQATSLHPPPSRCCPSHPLRALEPQNHENAPLGQAKGLLSTPSPAIQASHQTLTRRPGSQPVCFTPFPAEKCLQPQICLKSQSVKVSPRHWSESESTQVGPKLAELGRGRGEVGGGRGGWQKEEIHGCPLISPSGAGPLLYTFTFRSC